MIGGEPEVAVGVAPRLSASPSAVGLCAYCSRPYNIFEQRCLRGAGPVFHRACWCRFWLRLAAAELLRRFWLQW